MGLGTGIGHRVPLPIQTADEHRTSMLFAYRLIRPDDRRIVFFRQNVTQSFAKTAPAELLRTTEKFNRIVRAKRRDEKLHGAKVPVAEWQDVGPHGLAIV